MKKHTLFQVVNHSYLVPPDLEATQGQMDGFFRQLLYKCYLEEVASVGDWLKRCPPLDSRVANVTTARGSSRSSRPMSEACRAGSCPRSPFPRRRARPGPGPHTMQDRSRPSMAHVRQSKPNFGLSIKDNVFKTFKIDRTSLGSEGTADRRTSLLFYYSQA